MNTQENNKLIAEFMGVEPKQQSPDVYSLNDAPFFYCTETTPEKCLNSWSKYAKYNSSWGWLMPVVEMIESKGYAVNIFSVTETRIPLAGISILHEESKIKSVYMAVLQFIKWYNKQPLES